MNIAVETYNNNIHKALNDNSVIINNNTKKEWIQLPTELGRKKCKVIDTLKIKCMCNKHNTELYRLEGKYMTMYCSVLNGWQWLEKMTDDELKSVIVK